MAKAIVLIKANPGVDREVAGQIKKIEGVENLLSVSNSYDLIKNTREKQFEIKPVFPERIFDIGRRCDMLSKWP